MASPTIVSGIPELKSYVGKPLGMSDWVEVTQERIDAFAAATGDRQWIHVDVERARRESPFGQTIAHGYLTIALVPVLLPQILQIENASMVVNSGLEKMKLPSPVPAGARVRLGAEIKHVRDMPSGGARVVLSLRVEVEGATRPACTADAVYVYFP